MEGLGILLFIVFAVLAGLGRVKQGTGAPRPGTRLPPRPGAPSLPGRPGTSPGPQTERAEALVPEELWAILTGERRLPPPVHRPPQPSRGPAPEQEGSSFEAPAAELPLESTREDAGAEPEVEWQPPRPLPDSRPGRAPAAEPLPAPPVAASTAAAAVPALEKPAARPTPVRAARPRVRGLFSTPDEMRRAFVVQTVLGPPKALE